jgi:hypothetical protein
MHVKVVAQGGRGDHRLLLVLIGQFSKLIAGLAVDDGALFNPADFVLFGFYPEEAASALHNFQFLPVGHLRHAV